MPFIIKILLRSVSSKWVMCGVVIDMSVGRDVSLTSRRSNDSEGDDSVIGGSGEPVKRLAHPAPSAPES